jgi:hypothetical protein
MLTRRRLVCAVLYAEPCFADGVQALLKSSERANHNTVPIYPAPRIVLGLGSIANSDDPDADSQDEQQEPHGRLLVAPPYKCLSSCFIPSRRSCCLLVISLYNIRICLVAAVLYVAVNNLERSLDGIKSAQAMRSLPALSPSRVMIVHPSRGPSAIQT